MNEFGEQVGVVTGSAQGLGFAIAQLLSERGARVAMLDVDTERLTDSVARLGGGNRVIGIETDVTNETSLGNARQQILDRFERVDVLVNNVGTYPHASLTEISVADWDHVFDVNAKSMFLTTRTFMGSMVDQGYGRIVSIVTVDAYQAKPSTPHYAAAKAAVWNLIKSFALELAPHGVLVNGVSPGAIATERAKGESWLAERIKEIPVGYAAEPSDIAEIVAFLASRRNRFMTGETVIASGGATMI